MRALRNYVSQNWVKIDPARRFEIECLTLLAGAAIAASVYFYRA
jgi:hypothetical protein